MTLVLWTETTNASARSYERRHLSRSTSRKSVAGSVSSYRTSRREIASPTTGDQQGGCKTLEKLQTTGRGGAGDRRDSHLLLLLRLRRHQRLLVGEECLLVLLLLLLLWGASWRRARHGPHLDGTCPGIPESRPRPGLPTPLAPQEGCCEDAPVSFFWPPLPLPHLLQWLWRASSERPWSQTRRCPWGLHCRLQGWARQSGWR